MSKRFYGKGINYNTCYYMYSNKRIINIYKYLSLKELEILRKIGIIIENKLYTQQELEIFENNLYEYYKTDKKNNVVKNTYIKNIGITRNDYMRILNIFEKIYIDYNI